MKTTIYSLFMILSWSLMAQSDKLPYPESHFFRSGADSLHYRHWQPQGEHRGRIALVHGFCGATISWRNNVQALRELGFEVVAVDLPPFGFSSKQKKSNYSTSAHTLRLWQLLDSLAPQQTWTLMGHSLGGSVIGVMAAHRPAQVDKLIFVDGLAGVESAPNGFQRFVAGNGLTKSLAEWAGKHYYFKHKRIEKLLLGAYGQKPDSEAVTAHLLNLNHKGTAAGIFQMSASKPVLTPDFSRITAQKYVIWGEDDNWIPLTSAQKSLLRLKWDIPIQVIKGAAHCPMETHSGQVNDYLTKILK